MWVHSLACLYLLRYVKPDASIIQSTALRRSPTRDTLLRVTCAHDTTTAMYTRVCTARRGWSRNVQARALLLQDIPDSPWGGWPCDISCDTDVTSWGWRVGLTLSEICAARYLSSWRFRPECLAKRHLFPFSSRRIKKYFLVSFRINDVPPKIRFELTTFTLLGLTNAIKKKVEIYNVSDFVYNLS